MIHHYIASRFRHRDRVKLTVVAVLLFLFSLSYLRHPYSISPSSFLVTQLNLAQETGSRHNTSVNPQVTATSASTQVSLTSSFEGVDILLRNLELATTSDKHIETDSQAIINAAPSTVDIDVLLTETARFEARQSRVQALDSISSPKVTNEKDIPLTMPVDAPVLPQLIFPIDQAELLDGELTLIGTGKPNTVVQALDYSIILGTTPVDINGEWYFTFTPSSGMHEFAVRHIDDQTTKSNSVIVIVTDDINNINCNSNPGLELEDHYIVGTCDTICEISQQLGLTCEALIAANPHIGDPNLIFPGQLLTASQ